MPFSRLIFSKKKLYMYLYMHAYIDSEGIWKLFGATEQPYQLNNGEGIV